MSAGSWASRTSTKRRSGGWRPPIALWSPILTDGGPGTLTEVTNYYSYIQAFNFSYLGYSSAITVVLVVATVLLSWIIIRAVGWGERGE